MDEALLNKLKVEAQRIEEDSVYASKSHYNSSDDSKSLHYCLGIPATILAAVAGGFAFVGNNDVSAIASLFVTLLVGLATFLNPSGSQYAHHLAASSYSELKNNARFFYEIELYSGKEQDELIGMLKHLREKHNKLNESSPIPSSIAFEKARDGLEKGEYKYKVDLE